MGRQELPFGHFWTGKKVYPNSYKGRERVVTILRAHIQGQDLQAEAGVGDVNGYQGERGDYPIA